MAPIYRRNHMPPFRIAAAGSRARSPSASASRSEAEDHFLAARDGFLAVGVPYDAALVSLELALLYAEQKRLPELESLARELLCIFASRGIEREAIAALVCLRQTTAARAS